ncbi:hypothetical protein [Dysgonomonas sp. BGC7]|uniref:EF-Tu C-terminal domain-related protein n=1 Tax=Dysgonomonas sp. BGC7 TaxID=1658008 RepID=UPI0006830BA2|nr:hypothetical protein [Dysgonomonas sp. BGC7]MBD8389024.1 elongation factor Tu [Dysgonomonas sp. BGC7]
MSQYNRFTYPIPEIRASIYYLTEREGGRKTPVSSGYRGQFYYDDTNWDACQTFIGQDVCLLGKTVDCYLTTASPQFHLKQLHIGKVFEIREGARVVGKGIITEVLNPKFLIEQ